MYMISEVIVVLLILLCASYPKQFVPFSHTSLGRFLAVTLIVYFTKKNALVGLFVCVAAILYYQRDDSKYMLNVPEGFLWELTYTPYSTEVYDNLYSQLTGQFRQEHCSAGKLMYKGVPVRTDMAEHVFPELKFEGAPCDPCNARCNFTILQKKLSTESALRQQSSKKI